MTNPIVNFLLFQTCWLANVGGAAVGWPVAGPLFTAVWIGIHLGTLPEDKVGESRLLLAAAAFGFAADSLLALLGLIEFPDHARFGWPSPAWMVALWIGFAATLRHALRWLNGRLITGAILGAVGGPLAYRAGEILGAVAIPQLLPGLAAVSFVWLVAMPVLLWISKLKKPDPAFELARSSSRTGSSR